MSETIKLRPSLLGKTKKKMMSILPLFRKNYTYISQEVSFDGDLSAHENIVLEGKMHGNIRASQHVSLGPTARFEGTIECESASISGIVTGCVRTSKTIIVRIPATVTGDLISASVQIESGVTLNGRIISKPQGTPEETARADVREQTLLHLVEPVESK